MPAAPPSAGAPRSPPSSLHPRRLCWCTLLYNWCIILYSYDLLLHDLLPPPSTLDLDTDKVEPRSYLTIPCFMYSRRMPACNTIISSQSKSPAEYRTTPPPLPSSTPLIISVIIVVIVIAVVIGIIVIIITTTIIISPAPSAD